jgi:hypothetical protein
VNHKNVHSTELHIAVDSHQPQLLHDQEDGHGGDHGPGDDGQSADQLPEQLLNINFLFIN